MNQKRKKTIIGQVGLGRWGKNLLRNFSSLPDTLVKYACDLSPSCLDGLKGEYPSTIFVNNY